VSDASYHLMIFAFDFRETALLAREQAVAAAKAGTFALSDWAVITKEAGGKTKIESSQSVDPGALRGGLVGGTAGMILAVASGPIGVGAMLGGAAIGAATAALKDSGFPEKRLQEMSTLMRDDRSLLLLAVPMEERDKVAAFVDATIAFNGTDGRLEYDITPSTTLSDVMADYRFHEED
jgi:uncharacterized membrane protein